MGEHRSIATPGLLHRVGQDRQPVERLLIDNARRKQSLKGGGGRRREDLDLAAPVVEDPDLDLLALDEALVKLEQRDPRKAQLVKLRFFAGLTVEQAAQALGIATSTADADWAYARSWLRLEIAGGPAGASEQKKSDSAG
jgi:RNA polymerase sigma factor (TIGR02999 family)